MKFFIRLKINFRYFIETKKKHILKINIKRIKCSLVSQLFKIFIFSSSIKV